MDALDVVLVHITGIGLEIQAEVISCLTIPFDPQLSDNLRSIASGVHCNVQMITEINAEFSQLHLVTLRELLKGKHIDLIAVHGQTIFHKPPISWQLLSPGIIAYGLHTPIVFDLRSADLCAGGQGAPITPLADFILFRSTTERRAIINLGGFCNITVIERGSMFNLGDNHLTNWKTMLRGGDVCACNHLLDDLMRTHLNIPFDRNGKIASQGKINKSLYQKLINLLSEQCQQNRSLGSGDELFNWYKDHEHLQIHDLARTACAAIATIITKPGPIDRLILAGGGVKNNALITEIKDRSLRPVNLSDDFGVPIAYREAIAIAILGTLCWDRIPITIGNITGAVIPPLAGSWIIP